MSYDNGDLLAREVDERYRSYKEAAFDPDALFGLLTGAIRQENNRLLAQAVLDVAKEQGLDAAMVRSCYLAT
jgi:hypothetical protein